MSDQIKLERKVSELIKSVGIAGAVEKIKNSQGKGLFSCTNNNAPEGVMVYCKSEEGGVFVGLHSPYAVSLRKEVYKGATVSDLLGFVSGYQGVGDVSGKACMITCYKRDDGGELVASDVMCAEFIKVEPEDDINTQMIKIINVYG